MFRVTYDDDGKEDQLWVEPFPDERDLQEEITLLNSLDSG